MSKTKLIIATAAVALLLPAMTFAATGNTAAYCRGQAGYSSTQALNTGTLTQMITYGDCQISQRNTDLNAGLTRIGQMEKVSSSTQELLTQGINNTLSSLSTLESTLNADTATSTAIQNVRQIFNANRVYLLVLPRTWNYAAADRELYTVGILQGIETTLQTANSEASSSVQQETAPWFTQMTTGLTNTTSYANNAESGIVNLVPDNGNQTVLASNNQAIATARSNVKAGQTDLQDADQAAKKIKNLLGLQ